MGSKSSSFQFWSPIYYVVQTHFQIATKKNGSQNKDFFYLEPIITAKRPPATAKTVILSTKLDSKSHFFPNWSPFYPKTARKFASATFRNLPRPSSHHSTTSRGHPATISQPSHSTFHHQHTTLADALITFPSDSSSSFRNIAIHNYESFSMHCSLDSWHPRIRRICKSGSGSHPTALQLPRRKQAATPRLLR